MNKWVFLGISALSDFVVTAGTAMMAIDVNTNAQSPSWWQIAVCVIGGLVQAARGLQKNLSPPPP